MIPQRKVNNENEFIYLGDTLNIYGEDLKKFPKMSKEEQNKFLIEFGKDTNTLTLQLFEWIHKDDKNE